MGSLSSPYCLLQAVGDSLGGSGAGLLSVGHTRPLGASSLQTTPLSCPFLVHHCQAAATSAKLLACCTQSSHSHLATSCRYLASVRYLLLLQLLTDFPSHSLSLHLSLVGTQQCKCVKPRLGRQARAKLLTVQLCFICTPGAEVVYLHT